MKVNIIHRPLLLAFLTFPEDSNVESSNMSQPQSGGIDTLSLDTAQIRNVPAVANLNNHEVKSPYQSKL
ncbi:MAG TPA: hypothetical protein VKU93_02470 [Terracidiphilus sp.]|nr:hypothetical protein [Terracidiphilus sp.]